MRLLSDGSTMVRSKRRVLICDYWGTATECKNKILRSNTTKMASNIRLFVCFWRDSRQWAGASSFTRFLDDIRHTTLGRTPLDEWLARRRDLYLITHNTSKRQTSLPSTKFEPAIPASEWPQTHASDGANSGIGAIADCKCYCGIYRPRAAWTLTVQCLIYRWYISKMSNSLLFLRMVHVCDRFNMCGFISKT